MSKMIKQILKRYYAIIILFYFIMRIKKLFSLSVNQIESDSGSTHDSLSPEASVGYISSVFNDYKFVSGIKQFYGNVCEIGAGDNIGVALNFLADGCTQVDLPDMYYSMRDQAKQHKIYAKLMENNMALQQLLKEANLSDETTFPGIKRYYGKSASAEKFFNQPDHYDFIVSRAVLEHVNDPISSLKYMLRALKPGGKMIHAVDLRDHGMFSHDFHELKFLEVPNFIYRQITNNTGYPNRILFHKYNQFFQSCGYEYKIFIERLAGVGKVDPYRSFDEIPTEIIQKSLTYLSTNKSKFSNLFKYVDDRALIITGFFVVITKTSQKMAVN